MKIIVDAMGGDHAPKAQVLGAIEAAKTLGVEIVLVGKSDEILQCLKEEGIDTLPQGIEIAFASQVITMCDNPTAVLHTGKDSSMVVGAKLLASGGGDAFVSAGNTGALLTVATLVVKRIKGIKRAAVCPVCPTETGNCVILDAGANNECTPEYLLQFGYMGSFYAERYLGISKPRIGLLNNGSEESKGRELQKEAYALLKAAGEAGDINFVGNVEGRDVPCGKVDVVVCDGFSGNVLLKSIEGTAIFLAHKIKDMFKSSFRTKLGYLFCKKGVEDFKKLLDYREVGGSMFLGISKPVVKAHGSSDDYAMMNAIRQAKLCVETGVCEAIGENIDKMTVRKTDA
jgi:glycerol-3-phosphate acyltransferase PlsX